MRHKGSVLPKKKRWGSFTFTWGIPEDFEEDEILRHPDQYQVGPNSEDLNARRVVPWPLRHDWKSPAEASEAEALHRFRGYDDYSGHFACFGEAWRISSSLNPSW